MPTSSNPGVEDHGVFAVGDQLVRVVGVKGHTCLMSIVHGQLGGADWLLRFNGPIPHTHLLQTTRRQAGRMDMISKV